MATSGVCGLLSAGPRGKRRMRPGHAVGTAIAELAIAKTHSK